VPTVTVWSAEFVASMMADSGDPTDDFYAVLGVDSDASPDEIRTAYRERVKETHPDQNDADDAGERFQRVKRAEEVLTDPAERTRYDRLGHERYVADEAVGGASRTEGPGDAADAAGSEGPDREAEAAGTTGNGTTGSGSGRRQRQRRRGRRQGGVGAGRRGPEWGASATDGADGDDPAATAAGGAGTLGDHLGRGLRFFDRQQLRISTSDAVFGFAAFFLYPIFLASSVAPTFPLPVNLVLACCLLCTVGYLLATPEVGVLVFGAWTLFGPVLFLFADQPLLSWSAFFLVATTAIPFGLSLVVREVLRAP
jgi:hypothetical protein